jgi:required for meiotic nuclear division protein 1
VKDNINVIKYKCFAVTNELDLNKIALSCGIPKKYTWEEPLILKSDILSGIFGIKVKDNQMILVFSFGSIVFINLAQDNYSYFMKYLKNYKSDIDVKNFTTYNDDFELRIGDVDSLELTDSYACISEYEPFYSELAAMIIAKSVSLERIESSLEPILDKLDSIIDRLEKGKLRIGEKELARTTAKAARHEYNTINSVMILDKPDITWTNSSAEDFYSKMSEFFELNDRFLILKSKTDIINNIIGAFTSISHSMRGLFVEWIIIILIIAEVILMLFDLFK